MTQTRIIGRKRHDAAGQVDPPSGTTLEPFQGRFLALGTHLHEFEIIDVVAMGGFGIVYRAHDHSLDRMVAIKEYMPGVLAERTFGSTVEAISSQEAETFQAGLQSFVNEARLLARFDHPSLLKVFRFWEGNGTAYMAMPLLEGKTLKATLADMGRVPEETWLKGMLVNLLDGLDLLHRENCFHRDIAPDNILILPDGKPLLLDFGAARRVIGDKTQALTVILKPGYAPPEQYADAAQIRQGAWTDIYALAGVLYFSITGKTPMPAVTRMLDDTQKKLLEIRPEGFSPCFLAAVDQALSLSPQARPQSVSEWLPLLGLHANSPLSEVHSKNPGSQAATAGKTGSKQTALVTFAGRKTSRAIGISVALLGVALLSGYLVWQPQGQEVSVKQLPPVVPMPQASAPVVEVSPAAQISEIVFDPSTELNRVFGQRDPSWELSVFAEKEIVRIGRDKLKFRLTSGRSGFVYVLMVGTKRDDFSLIFPNDIDSNNHIDAHGEFNLPRKGWSMTAAGPAGTNQFVVLISEHRRNFSASGMTAVPPFAQVNPTLAQKELQRSGTQRSLFAGDAVCPEINNCSNSYGAATLTIHEVN